MVLPAAAYQVNSTWGENGPVVEPAPASGRTWAESGLTRRADIEPALDALE